jgi:hypothetical protein
MGTFGEMLGKVMITLSLWIRKALSTPRRIA